VVWEGRGRKTAPYPDCVVTSARSIKYHGTCPGKGPLAFDFVSVGVGLHSLEPLAQGPMDTASLAALVDDPASAASLLSRWRIADLERGARNLASLARSGLTFDLLGVLCEQLSEHLPASSDPDRVLNNLDRFLSAARSPLALGALFERDSEALPTLLQIFSASQSLSEQLIRDPEAFELVRLTDGQATPREWLIKDVVAEVSSLPDERSQIAALRRIKQRETLRIAYGDVVKRQSIEVVTRQISSLADALVEAAVASARRKYADKRPQRSDGSPARFVVIALGKLGGEELNYSSDIDLLFVCDTIVGDAKRTAAAADYFERVARGVIKLLSESTPLGVAYRVDMRLRPHGSQGPIVMGLEETLQYYDVHGRTWERQAFVKARAIAGDLDLGRSVLAQLEPWVYRRYLSRADITGIKALKRRIEHRAEREAASESDVKTGRGGLRDIEFVIQFLQLLNGGDLPEIRTGNTLAAIGRLEGAGCLTHQERTILEDSYAFLRKLEHRLQIMFDLQTHSLPADDAELRKLAIRMNYADGESSALERFNHDYHHKRELNRRILDHLLHSAFPDDDEAAPEIDLVLDPDPPRSAVNDILGPYGFRDTVDAYHHLMELATEKIPFLSTRRCRHFLAAIAPRLLKAISETPDPDFTLRTLSSVSDSLGGKGVLWELFSFNPPTLHLYVRLCATSPYLAGVLTSSPGMIDELLDSLLLDKLPTFESLERMLAELTRGADDLGPILGSFKNSMHLRVGVRDILGKEEITATHRALSDIMEAVITRVAQQEYARLMERYGEPITAEGPRAGQACEMVMVALGKLGGREPNYHSDADVIFLYEAEGTTQHAAGRKSKETTSNSHFFGQLAQRIIKVVTQLGPLGRLYEMDARLRPIGNSGPLAISLDDFLRYHREGESQLWERQTLCKARPIFGSQLVRIKTMHALRQAILARPWQPEFAIEIEQMRQRLEADAAPTNLKRGRGGTVDVEFAVQMLQLKHAAENPGLLVPGTLDAIAALKAAGVVAAVDAQWWSESYLYLRRVESGLRLMNTTARHDLPHDHAELRRLAFLLGTSSERLAARCHDLMIENRRRFAELVRSESGSEGHRV
jgi:[glutamine synthetase] adenylyltransferase / [glutamine synthetase]-adenylyl-L-tyrosine phosphorylase